MGIKEALAPSSELPLAQGTCSLCCSCPWLERVRHPSAGARESPVEEADAGHGSERQEFVQRSVKKGSSAEFML